MNEQEILDRLDARGRSAANAMNAAASRVDATVPDPAFLRPAPRRSGRVLLAAAITVAGLGGAAFAIRSDNDSRDKTNVTSKTTDPPLTTGISDPPPTTGEAQSSEIAPVTSGVTRDGTEWELSAGVQVGPTEELPDASQEPTFYIQISTSSGTTGSGQDLAQLGDFADEVDLSTADFNLAYGLVPDDTARVEGTSVDGTTFEVEVFEIADDRVNARIIAFELPEGVIHAEIVAYSTDGTELGRDAVQSLGEEDVPGTLRTFPSGTESDSGSGQDTTIPAPTTTDP